MPDSNLLPLSEPTDPHAAGEVLPPVYEELRVLGAAHPANEPARPADLNRLKTDQDRFGFAAQKKYEDYLADNTD
jgi:hypothetical protein